VGADDQGKPLDAFVEGPGKAKPFPETAVVEGSRLFSNWLGLSDERRLELRLPMQRLNSAMRRPSLVDSAIDLGMLLNPSFCRTAEVP